MTLSFERRLAHACEASTISIAPYITAGDGCVRGDGLAPTLKVLQALEQAGAACVELGVPFSDPVADGPVLQAAAQRALAAGTNLKAIIELVARYRDAGGELAIALFSYANPLLRGGLEATLRRAAEAGVDALLVPDWPHDEDPALGQAAESSGLACVNFVAPTTSDERIASAAAASRGFLYAIGRLGVTGAATTLDENTLAFLQRVRAQTDLPLGVGFGLRTAQDVARLRGHAQLAIVGSALVEHLHRAREGGASVTEVARLAADYIHHLQPGAER